MSELIPSGTQTTTAVQEPETQLQLVAENAEQMAVAQTQMVEWFATQKRTLEADLEENQQELAIAEQHGWRTVGFKRTASLLRRRIEFYEKCRQASEAGYVIVPNMPCNIFAVRTARDWPERSAESPSQHDVSLVRSEAPAAGEGQYVDDQAFTRSRVERVPDTDRTHTLFRPVEFDTEIDFPVTICKPQLMSATAKAMALKVFDELAVVDDSVWGSGATSGRVRRRRGRGDPLLVGIIRDPRRVSYDDRRITFLIGWYIDTRLL